MVTHPLERPDRLTDSADKRLKQREDGTCRVPADHMSDQP